MVRPYYVSKNTQMFIINLEDLVICCEATRFTNPLSIRWLYCKMKLDTCQFICHFNQRFSNY